MERKTIKHLIIGGSISFLALASAILSFVNLSDAIKGKPLSKEWMKEVDDSKLLSQISIPGTHDSCALYSIGDLAGKCQDLSIAKQLDMGARYLDIRLELKNGELKVVHGLVDERDTFDNVVAICQAFLAKHNSETIIMAIKEENVAKKGDFSKTLEEKIDKNKDLWYLENTIPSLADVRGKIVLFSRYNNTHYGVNLYNGWQDNSIFNLTNGLNTYHVQDHYKFENVETKWSDVVECLDFGNTNILPNVFTINYCSGYLLNTFPPSYSVPVAKYINPKAEETLSSYTNTGTVLFDFINEDLAKAVYERNL